MQPGEVQRWRLIDAGVEEIVLFKIAGAQPRKLGGVDEWTISPEAIGPPADDLLGGSAEPIEISVR